MRGFEDFPSDWCRTGTFVDRNLVEHSIIEFVVNGQPIQKGNIIRNPHGGYRDVTKGIGDWVEMVQTCAKVAMSNRYGRRTNPKAPNSAPLKPFADGVLLDITIVRQRLKKHGKKHAGPHITTPDTDKLVRGIGDGLTGIVYTDDCQSVEILGRKRWAEPDERPGAHIIAVSGVLVSADEALRWDRVVKWVCQ